MDPASVFPSAWSFDLYPPEKPKPDVHLLAPGLAWSRCGLSADPALLTGRRSEVTCGACLAADRSVAA